MNSSLPDFEWKLSSLYYIRPGSGIVPVPPITLAGRFVIACPYWLVITIAVVLYVRNERKWRPVRPT